MPPLGFLTHQGLALLCIASDPAIRIRDIAAHIGVAGRAAQRIVADLVEAGYVQRERTGRRNLYHVNPTSACRCPTLVTSTCEPS